MSTQTVHTAGSGVTAAALKLCLGPALLTIAGLLGMTVDEQREQGWPGEDPDPYGESEDEDAESGGSPGNGTRTAMGKRKGFRSDTGWVEWIKKMIWRTGVVI